MPIENQEDRSKEEPDPYSLFLYAIRSEITRNYYLRRLRIFFNHINLLTDRTMKERCNEFASKGSKLGIPLHNKVHAVPTGELKEMRLQHQPFGNL
jgi:hypothetical protein